ncbi:hypothetical protein ZHAS_00016667 [Anopheles sinensis]|uniref:Uncharacterized protein n=1 Tax=Anopheles sinensis TaxID=74873 RepID=A0A084WEM6_ANOSI|nr:hypothetical protein ZHAS_00016667 [Anopheles sinensis]
MTGLILDGPKLANDGPLKTTVTARHVDAASFCLSQAIEIPPGIFKFSSADVQASEHLLHASVLSMVEFDDDIFAGGNCFDWNQHPAKRGLFCPFAYRLPPPDQGASLVKDLALEYHYLGNTSEWFFLARKNAEKVIARNEQYIKYKISIQRNSIALKW